MTVHKIHTRMVFDMTTGELEEDEFYYHDTEVDGPIAMAFGGGNGDGNEGGGDSHYEEEQGRLRGGAQQTAKKIRQGKAKGIKGTKGQLSKYTIASAIYDTHTYSDGTAAGSYTPAYRHSMKQEWGDTPNRSPYWRDVVSQGQKVATIISQIGQGKGRAEDWSGQRRYNAALSMLASAGVRNPAQYLPSDFGGAGAGTRQRAEPTQTRAAAENPYASMMENMSNMINNLSNQYSSAIAALSTAATGYQTTGTAWPGAPSWVKTFEDYMRWRRGISKEEGYLSTVLSAGEPTKTQRVKVTALSGT